MIKIYNWKTEINSKKVKIFNEGKSKDTVMVNQTMKNVIMTLSFPSTRRLCNGCNGAQDHQVKKGTELGHPPKSIPQQTTSRVASSGGPPSAATQQSLLFSRQPATTG